MLWYLNQYIVDDKLKFKIVRNPHAYENWDLVDTYILYNKKFYTRETFRKIVSLNPPKSTFKKLLEFFNKL